jgi:hypothetical protein
MDVTILEILLKLLTNEDISPKSFHFAEAQIFSRNSKREFIRNICREFLNCEPSPYIHPLDGNDKNSMNTIEQ